MQADYNCEFVGQKYHFDQVFHDITVVIKLLVEVSGIEGAEKLTEW